jgi:RecA/RadA recombinase
MILSIAETYNLLFMLQSGNGKPAQMFGDPTTAIGGNIVGHASTFVYIFEEENKVSSCKIS